MGEAPAVLSFPERQVPVCTRGKAVRRKSGGNNDVMYFFKYVQFP